MLWISHWLEYLFNCYVGEYFPQKSRWYLVDQICRELGLKHFEPFSGLDRLCYIVYRTFYIYMNGRGVLVNEEALISDLRAEEVEMEW